MQDQDSTGLVSVVRELGPEISARAGEIEAGRRLPVALVERLKAAGLFRMFVPRSHGGLEVDLRAGLDVLEALARIDGSTAWTVMIGAETPQVLALLSRARFDAIYAGGPDVILGGGSNVQGEAHVSEGGYRVTGRWSFASGSEHCDYLFGNCVVMQDGAPRPGPAPELPETRGVLFPASSARVIDTWNALGLRGTGSHDIAVDDLLCPAEDSLDLFAGVPSVPGPGFVAPVLHILLHMAAVAVGVAQGAIDDAAALAKAGKRRLFARGSLAQSPVFQVEFGRAEIDVRAARALLHATADEFWAACVRDPAAVPGVVPRLSATLAWVVEATGRAVDVCYRGGGGGAARDASPLQRRFRDIHTLSQHALAAEGWFGPHGALLLGQPAGFASA